MCLGRDANGVPLTRATAAYTDDLVSMLVSAVSYVVGSPSVMRAAAAARAAAQDSRKHAVYTGESSTSLPSVDYSDSPRYLYLARTRAGQRMVPVRQTGPIDTRRGTLRVSGKRRSYDAPIAHLRPFVSSLVNEPWTGEAHEFTHGSFYLCDTEGCESPATHAGCGNPECTFRVCHA